MVIFPSLGDNLGEQIKIRGVKIFPSKFQSRQTDSDKRFEIISFEENWFGQTFRTIFIRGKLIRTNISNEFHSRQTDSDKRFEQFSFEENWFGQTFRTIFIRGKLIRTNISNKFQSRQTDSDKNFEQISIEANWFGQTFRTNFAPPKNGFHLKFLLGLNFHSSQFSKLSGKKFTFKCLSLPRRGINKWNSRRSNLIFLFIFLQSQLEPALP
jgi:hypothetical protein